MKQIALDVREFAVQYPREGSIEPGSGYGFSMATTLGQEVHKLIQQRHREEDETYKAEAKISHKFQHDDFCILVSGRIDGLFQHEHPKIEEIKTAFRIAALAQRLRSDRWHPYRLQLDTYCYLYWKQFGIMPHGTLHLVSLLGKESNNLEFPLNLAEYEGWLGRRLAGLVEDARFQEKEYKRRQRLAAKLEFPFTSAREGQAELMQQIEKGMSKGKPILVQAPTGLGKTVAVLLPALKEALSRGHRVVYTTPKNSLHLVAEDAIKRLRTRKAALKSLTLTAKAKMCLLPEPVCDPKVCEYARDYYKKVSDHQLVEEAAKSKHMTPQLFAELGKKHKVCPFELSIDCIERADVVICDYNHVFAPVSLSGRLTAAAHKKNARPNLIIDEAHNLHTRAADYFSASISSSQLAAWQKELTISLPQVAVHAADGMNIVTDASAGRTNNKSFDIELNSRQFSGLADRIGRTVMDLVEESAAVEQISPALAFSRSWSDFTTALTHENIERFTTCKTDSGDVTLKVTCCDGSAHLRAQYKLFENVIAFSATLKPFDYYTSLSGFDNASCELLEAKSPFPRHNRKVMVIPQISTRYKDRQDNYGKIADAIDRITAVKRVNYIIFFPSFDFLDRIAERVTASGYKFLVQRRQMSRDQISGLLDELKTTQPSLLFAVQGGIFAEGIDFAGDMASAAIIVGPGLPTYDLERELLRQYYDKTYGSGFEYAYVYPAMTKVIQSAGRIVRSETDRGLLVLMDQRFLSHQYARAMPADWFHQNVTELVSNSILKDISEFWQGSGH